LYTLFFGLLLANFLILICGTILSKYAAKVTIIPINVLAPTIIALGITSTYLMRGNVIDVFVAIIAGVVGYFMKKYEYSPIPFVVAVILAPIAERSFFQALLTSGGSYWTFVRRPISGSLFLLCIIVIVLPAVMKKIKKNIGGKTR